MFFRLYKYSIFQSLRDKLTLFWNLIFPIVLGTLFQLSFGGYAEEEVIFRQIPVAYAAEEEEEAFGELLKELEEDSGLIKVQTAEYEEARRLLKEGKVEGIYHVEPDTGAVTLIVAEQEVNQTILNSILEQYQRASAAFSDIARENPAEIQAAAACLEEECRYLKAGSVTDASMNNTMDCFYSLVAMTCLMGATSGLIVASDFKADATPLAARRAAAGASRIGMLLPDLAAKITMQFLYTALSICYLTFALGIDLGEHWGLMFLTALTGSILGIMIGFFIGVAGKIRYGIKEGLCIGIMLVSSFFSGLMFQGMARIVETYVPVLNQINPATLVSKALYSLNIYDNLGPYFSCLGRAAVLILVLGAGAFLLVRRERYAAV